MTAKQIDEEEGTQKTEIVKDEGGKKVRECDRAGRLEKRSRNEGEKEQKRKGN